MAVADHGHPGRRYRGRIPALPLKENEARMSDFICEHCDAPHWDTPRGYVSGCLCYGEGGNQVCDVCLNRMEVINPDGWLRCRFCYPAEEADSRKERHG